MLIRGRSMYCTKLHQDLLQLQCRMHQMPLAHPAPCRSSFAVCISCTEQWAVFCFVIDLLSILHDLYRDVLQAATDSAARRHFPPGSSLSPPFRRSATLLSHYTSLKHMNESSALEEHCSATKVHLVRQQFPAPASNLLCKGSSPCSLTCAIPALHCQQRLLPQLITLLLIRSHA